MRFPTMWYVRPAKAQICAQSDQSLFLSLEYSMTVQHLAEQHLEFLRLTGGCACSSESVHVKMPHCLKSHVTAHIVSTFRCIEEQRRVTFCQVDVSKWRDYVTNCFFSYCVFAQPFVNYLLLKLKTLLQEKLRFRDHKPPITSPCY